MRLFCFFVCFILSLQTVSAWLFEYSQWKKTRINATKYERADIVESISIPTDSYVTPHTTFDHSSSYTTSYNSYDITSEMNVYISMANELRRDISKIRRYGSESQALRKQLQRDLKDINDHIRYLSKLRAEQARSQRYSYDYRYNNNFRSARLESYYNKYWYTRDYNSYYYNTRDGYYSRKYDNDYSFRDYGYIYIK